jgi:hypothetical protein
MRSSLTAFTLTFILFNAAGAQDKADREKANLQSGFRSFAGNLVLRMKETSLEHVSQQHIAVAKSS